ncbi:MAG TPA: hypothetical protein VE173_04445, partial [Longimicrobiales bacterium]|nr:hypothetical protein [Longimicrobiales bacterium]
TVFDVMDDRHGDVAAGVSAGYRLPILDSHASLRLEGRFRRWFDAGSSSLAVIGKVALVW